MTKKIIEMLNTIERKIVLKKELNKKEVDLIRALIRSAINDLVGVKNDS